MEVKLLPSNSTCSQLDEPTIAAMEVGYAEVKERIQDYRKQALPNGLINFAEGELHGLKLAAHALGYIYEECES